MTCIVGPASRIPRLGDTGPRYKTGNIPLDSTSMNGHPHTHADTPPRTSSSSKINVLQCLQRSNGGTKPLCRGGNKCY